MKGVIQTEPGNDQSLVVVDTIPIPEPKGREVLIRVQCTSLNRLDLIQAKNANYPLPPGASSMLGIEVSGNHTYLYFLHLDFYIWLI